MELSKEKLVEMGGDVWNNSRIYLNDALLSKLGFVITNSPAFNKKEEIYPLGKEKVYFDIRKGYFVSPNATIKKNMTEMGFNCNFK